MFYTIFWEEWRTYVLELDSTESMSRFHCISIAGFIFYNNTLYLVVIITPMTWCVDQVLHSLKKSSVKIIHKTIMPVVCRALPGAILSYIFSCSVCLRLLLHRECSNVPSDKNYILVCPVLWIAEFHLHNSSLQ